MWASAAAADLVILVVDSAGGPLADARIAIRKPSDKLRGIDQLLMRTNAKGEFRLPQPAPGRYVVEAFMPGGRGPYHFESASQEFEVPREEPLRIVLPGARLFEVSGVVVGLEGKLAWGRYLVEAHPIDSDDPEARPLAAPVNRHGHFALHGLERGRYEIRLAPLDVARSAFGRGTAVAEIDVAGDIKGLRLSAAGAQ